MTAPNFYIPSQQVIMQIVRGAVTSITTFSAHGYITGQSVRIIIPKFKYNNTVQKIPILQGMQQLNGNIYPITVTGPTAFTIPVDSTLFDNYITVVNPTIETSIGQVIPVGEPALTLLGATINNNNILPELYPPAPFPATP